MYENFLLSQSARLERKVVGVCWIFCAFFDPSRFESV